MAFLRYDISVVGVDRVRQATRAVEAELLASNRRLLGQGVGARRGTARSPQNETRSNSRRILSEEERANRERVRAHEKAERDKTRATLSEARKRDQAQAALQRQRSTALMQQYRLEEAAQRRTRADRTQMTRGVLGGTVSRTAAVGRGAIAATGLAGGALFVSGAHGAMRKQAAATELANQLEGGKGVTASSIAQRKADVLKVAGGVRGFSPEDIMASMGAFQGQAGEAEATMKVAPSLAKTALATGSDITGIGEMYSAIYASLRNATGGAKKSVDELLKQTDQIGTVFAAMGQVGAIELKDFQRIGSDVAATAGKFAAASPEEAIKNAAAAVQLARQSGGSKSAEEAATALRSFSSSVAGKTHKKSGKLMIGSREVGESIFTDSSMTQLKSLPEIIANTMVATKGNIPQLQELTGERGADITRAVSGAFLEATGGKTDKESLERGREAVLKQFEKFGGVAMSAEERELKASARLADADMMLEEQMRKLTTAVGEQLLPELVKLIPEISKLVPLMGSAASGMASLVSWFASNPLAGLATIIGAAFTAELASAGLKTIFEQALTGGAGGGTAGKVGGAMGAIALGAATFTIATATLEILGMSSEKSGMRAGRQINDLYTEYQQKRADILSGGGSAEEKARALGELGKQTGANVALQKESAGFLPGPLQGLENFVPALKALQWLTESPSAAAAQSGADAVMAKIAEDQAAAASALKGSAQALEALLPKMTINTSNQPTTPAVK